MKLFDEETILILRKLGINPYDTIFCNAKPLTEYFKKSVEGGGVLEELSVSLAEKLFAKRKLSLFVCRPVVTDGLYSFAPPEVFLPGERLPLPPTLIFTTEKIGQNSFPKKLPKPPKKISKHMAKIEKRLLSINNTYIRKLMAGAKKNAEFIERFNSELFFKHCFYGGRQLTVAELLNFYELREACQIIDLSSDADKLAFVALYAMTFYGLSSRDLFKIDGIFSSDSDRHTDNVKKKAGNDVFNLILRGDRAEIEKVLLEMGDALLNLPPVVFDISDMVTLSENYTLFVGLSEIGRVFMQSTVHTLQPKAVLGAARGLANYASLVALCDTISVLSNEDDYKKMNIYKKCKELGF